ncbi:uncharacterized protein FOMMEDRAFT_157979 [Fomitiporia mediterranea MF3/22]|uniref:uncharacterized protein n=1 Tax=Fomitiporia mediterranea (strain MF3/22) TaxID=694068 RepID=UPI000440855C|nr:uncharacterized protein FOMMEDRAFT_157979 [Fomitiporia mediterranea MF3/22]EJD00868.1 hypothetical protein FOMMEDRAFT_157979 [Fomitiporia mediterranea MF3/22]
MAPASENTLNPYLTSSILQDEEDDDGQLTPLCHPDGHVESSGSFFSRVKHSITSSPLGSILGHSSSTSLRSNNSESKGNDSNVKANLGVQRDDSNSVTPRRLSIIKHAFLPMPGRSPSHSRSATVSSTQSDISTDSSSRSACTSSFLPACFSPASQASLPTLATSVHDSDNEDKWSPTLRSPSDAQETPPLTPDMPQQAVVSYPNSDGAYRQRRSHRSASISIKDDGNPSSGSDSKKGKSPATPFPYDTLIADISPPTAPNRTKDEDLSLCDDNAEWWGLEYTLEMSRRDSRASDSSTSTTGEHSKSRESWAAIHQGAVPPVYADANYQDWQRWHRALDKIEIRRRRKRTIDFLEESEHLAGLFVDEMLAQRAVQIHEELLTEDEIYDALVWVEYASERRPDPFFPPERHSLGWVLKSHRSIACLRELQETPADDE